MKNALRFVLFSLLAIREVSCATGAALAGAWQRTQPLCAYCTRPVSLESVVRGEAIMWCAHCRCPSPTPVVKAPGWIVGTIGILAINAMRISCL